VYEGYLATNKEFKVAVKEIEISPSKKIDEKFKSNLNREIEIL